MNIDRSLPYYHIMDLPDGTTTPGRVDRRDDPAYLGFAAGRPLEGKRALDVGALDGVLSFWAERAGAEHVLAIDVEEIEKYDWGYEGPPESMLKLKARRKNMIFDHLKEVLGSKVEREPITVYDLDPAKHGASTSFSSTECYIICGIRCLRSIDCGRSAGAQSPWKRTCATSTRCCHRCFSTPMMFSTMP